MSRIAVSSPPGVSMRRDDEARARLSGVAQRPHEEVAGRRADRSGDRDQHAVRAGFLRRGRLGVRARRGGRGRVRQADTRNRNQGCSECSCMPITGAHERDHSSGRNDREPYTAAPHLPGRSIVRGRIVRRLLALPGSARHRRRIRADRATTTGTASGRRQRRDHEPAPAPRTARAHERQERQHRRLERRRRNRGHRRQPGAARTAGWSRRSGALPRVRSGS